MRQKKKNRENSWHIELPSREPLSTVQVLSSKWMGTWCLTNISHVRSHNSHHPSLKTFPVKNKAFISLSLSWNPTLVLHSNSPKPPEPHNCSRCCRAYSRCSFIALLPLLLHPIFLSLCLGSQTLKCLLHTTYRWNFIFAFLHTQVIARCHSCGRLFGSPTPLDFLENYSLFPLCFPIYRILLVINNVLSLLHGHQQAPRLRRVVAVSTISWWGGRCLTLQDSARRSVICVPVWKQGLKHRMPAEKDGDKDKSDPGLCQLGGRRASHCRP